MNPLFSNLHLSDFFILKSNFSFVKLEHSEKHPYDLESLFAKYEVDLDFAVKKEAGDAFNIYSQIFINQIEEPLPGYSITLEAVGVFQIQEPEQLDMDDIEMLKSHLALPLVIDQMRSHIAQVSASFPFGKFTLQPIDVQDLFARKKSAAFHQ